MCDCGERAGDRGRVCGGLCPAAPLSAPSPGAAGSGGLWVLLAAAALLNHCSVFVAGRGLLDDVLGAIRPLGPCVQVNLKCPV